MVRSGLAAILRVEKRAQTLIYTRTQDICDSQEAWWLRKGCRRARCQLIKGLADAFEIPVRSIQVTHYLTLRVNTSSTVKACRNTS